MRAIHLREHNLSLVLRELAFDGSPVSRAALARSTRLTKPTVSKFVDELLHAGLLEELEPVSQGAGRPMVPLRPSRGSVLGIGLEISAEQVAVLAIDLSGESIGHCTLQVDVQRTDPQEIVRLCAGLVAAIREENPQAWIVGVCLAVPGRIAPDGSTVLSAPGLDWEDVPVLEPLREELGHPDLEVRALNDNRLSVLHEMRTRQEQTFIYVRGGTGVGGAIVLDGTILEGVHGWAGEFGHTVVVPDGEVCRCGRRGCLEAYVSFTALRERAGLPEGIQVGDLVDHLMNSSDRAEVVSVIGRSIGLAVANALNILDVATVILAGHLAPIAQELAPVIRETVDEHALAVEAGDVVIATSDAVSEPALWGAARAAIEPIFASPGEWLRRIG